MNNGNNQNNVVYLHLDDILPNRFQPREVFDETGLEELADSIREHGVIQPIIVRQMGNKYELIAGERRSKASAMAGLTTIPAIIRNMDDKESAKVSLLENLQRKNLTAIEEARTYKKILELDNMTQDDLAKTMGKSQPLIANKLRLLSLPEEVQDALIKNQISERHARSLLNVNNKEAQLALLNRIRTERLTVRELDTEIKKINAEVPNDNTSSTDGRISYNEFNQTPDFTSFNELNQTQNFSSFSDNNRTNFGNMGLNDYQTSVNSNMFNNIPSNYQTSGNDYDNNNFNNNPFNSSDSNNYDNQPMMNSNDFSYNESTKDYEDFSTPLQTSSQNQSLGSVFDNQNINNSLVNNNTKQDVANENNNLFISQIKQDDMKPQENQFLPNFDTTYNDNQNYDYNYNNNNQINSNYDYNSFDNNLSSDNMYQGNNNGNEYPRDIDNYSANQGSLFNQPLNIVDVPKDDFASFEEPKNESYDIYNEKTNIENEKMQEASKFDNPLDDPYENILFAKPVAVKFDDEQPAEEEEVEVIDNNFNAEEEKDNKYISLEPEKTIFDAKGAVFELKKTTDRIKLNNINLDTEEIDFDDYYQIVIKIKKN